MKDAPRRTSRGGGQGAEGTAQPRGLSDAERAEDRADAAWLEARERGASPLPHVDPQRAESYQRIGEAIADLPDLAPPPGWDAKLRAHLEAHERAPREVAAVAEASSVVDEAGEAADAAGVSVAVASEVPFFPGPSAPPKQPAKTARGSTREMARTPREATPVESPPRQPVSLWLPAAGALAMAAAALVLAFGAGPLARRRSPGSDASTSQPSAARGGQVAAAGSALDDGADLQTSSLRAARTLPSEVVAAPGQVNRSAAPGAAALGDRFTLELVAPAGQLRLYRNHVEVARCPGAAECTVEERGAERRVALRYPMNVPGEYRAVYYQGSAMEERSQGLAEDQRRCRTLDEQAGARGSVCRWQMTVAHEVR